MPFIVGVCPTCSEVRYRSKRSYEPGAKETLKPEDFVAVGDQTPPEQTDQKTPIMCDKCADTIQFVPDAVPAETPKVLSDDRAERIRQAREATLAKAPKTKKVATPVSLPGVNAAVETLWEAQPDEVIQDMRDVLDGILIVTNKRIMRINLNE